MQNQILQERQASRADEDDEDEESDAQAQAAQEMLDMLKEDKDQNNGRLSDQYIIQFYKEKLLSMPCQNQVHQTAYVKYILQLFQGFVIDGFPKTYNHAKQLFDMEEMEEPDQEAATAITYNQLIMPGKKVDRVIIHLSSASFINHIQKL